MLTTDDGSRTKSLDAVVTPESLYKNALGVFVTYDLWSKLGASNNDNDLDQAIQLTPTVLSIRPTNTKPSAVRTTDEWFGTRNVTLFNMELGVANYKQDSGTFNRTDIASFGLTVDSNTYTSRVHHTLSGTVNANSCMEYYETYLAKDLNLVPLIKDAEQERVRDMNEDREHNVAFNTMGPLDTRQGATLNQNLFVLRRTMTEVSGRVVEWDYDRTNGGRKKLDLSPGFDCAGNLKIDTEDHKNYVGQIEFRIRKMCLDMYLALLMPQLQLGPSVYAAAIYLTRDKKLSMVVFMEAGQSVKQLMESVAVGQDQDLIINGEQTIASSIVDLFKRMNVAGVVHTDVKPGNIITIGNRAMVIDVDGDLCYADNRMRDAMCLNHVHAGLFSAAGMCYNYREKVLKPIRHFLQLMWDLLVLDLYDRLEDPSRPTTQIDEILCAFATRVRVDGGNGMFRFNNLLLCQKLLGSSNSIWKGVSTTWNLTGLQRVIPTPFPQVLANVIHILIAHYTFGPTSRNSQHNIHYRGCGTKYLSQLVPTIPGIVHIINRTSTPLKLNDLVQIRKTFESLYVNPPMGTKRSKYVVRSTYEQLTLPSKIEMGVACNPTQLHMFMMSTAIAMAFHIKDVCALCSFKSRTRQQSIRLIDMRELNGTRRRMIAANNALYGVVRTIFVHNGPSDHLRWKPGSHELDWSLLPPLASYSNSEDEQKGTNYTINELRLAMMRSDYALWLSASESAPTQPDASTSRLNVMKQHASWQGIMNSREICFDTELMDVALFPHKSPIDTPFNEWNVNTFTSRHSSLLYAATFLYGTRVSPQSVWRFVRRKNLRTMPRDELDLDELPYYAIIQTTLEHGLKDEVDVYNSAGGLSDDASLVPYTNTAPLKIGTARENIIDISALTAGIIHESIDTPQSDTVGVDYVVDYQSALILDVTSTALSCWLPTMYQKLSRHSRLLLLFSPIPLKVTPYKFVLDGALVPSPVLSSA